MPGELYVTTDAEAFKKTLEELTDKEAVVRREDKIRADFSDKYNIEGDVFILYSKGFFTLNTRRIHIDYLPTLDLMLKVADEYEHPDEVVGAALFKIEQEKCLFLTDVRDPNLQRLYERHKEDADKVAAGLWKLIDEEYPNQWTHASARILSGSFEVAFGLPFGYWRKNLE